MSEVLIGIGSNKGDRAAHLERARAGFVALPGTCLVAMSEPVETPAEGGVAEGDFLNAAALLETELAPRELLEALQRIEAEAGRPPAGERQRWGDRELDLDLLLYGDRVIDEPGLTVPHPRMGERRFVLEPAAAVAPEMVHPTLGRTVGELLEALGSEEARRE